MDTAKVQRVSEKLHACQLFLVHMAESRGDWQKFGSYLSAFLSAYRAIFWRLIRVADSRSERVRLAWLVEQLYKTNPTIGFLRNARDIEDHEFGIKYFTNVTFSRAYVPESRFAPRPSGRFDKARSVRYPAVREFHEFIAFKDHPQRDMIEFCAAGLDDAREFVHQTLKTIFEPNAA